MRRSQRGRGQPAVLGGRVGDGEAGDAEVVTHLPREAHTEEENVHRVEELREEGEGVRVCMCEGGGVHR